MFHIACRQLLIVVKKKLQFCCEKKLQLPYIISIKVTIVDYCMVCDPIVIRNETPDIIIT